jgi:chromosome segregation ATPase
MDQRTVESLLRRLVDRVEESERRYGEELDELHARLDQLSQTTEAARDTGAPGDDTTFDRLQTEVSGDDTTFDRLQTEVSNLTRQLEDEEALDELHARLDQLSQTTEAARDTGAPGDDTTFDRLQTEVRHKIFRRTPSRRSRARSHRRRPSLQMRSLPWPWTPTLTPAM